MLSMLLLAGVLVLLFLIYRRLGFIFLSLRETHKLVDRIDYTIRMDR